MNNVGKLLNRPVVSALDSRIENAPTVFVFIAAYVREGDVSIDNGSGKLGKKILVPPNGSKMHDLSKAATLPLEP